MRDLVPLGPLRVRGGSPLEHAHAAYCMQTASYGQRAAVACVEKAKFREEKEREGHRGDRTGAKSGGTGGDRG